MFLILCYFGHSFLVISSSWCLVVLVLSSAKELDKDNDAWISVVEFFVGVLLIYSIVKFCFFLAIVTYYEIAHKLHLAFSVLFIKPFVCYFQ